MSWCRRTTGREFIDRRALNLGQWARRVADLPGRVVQHHFTCRHSQPGWALQADRFTYAVFHALVSAGTRDVLRPSCAACPKNQTQNQSGKQQGGDRKNRTPGNRSRYRCVCSACRRRGCWSAERHPMMEKAYHDVSRLQARFPGTHRASRLHQRWSRIFGGSFSLKRPALPRRVHDPTAFPNRARACLYRSLRTGLSPAATSEYDRSECHCSFARHLPDSPRT